MFGNWAMGRVTIAITPTITSTIEITIATIGRLIKNFDIPLSSLRFARCHKRFWVHQRTGTNLLHPLGDNAFTELPSEVRALRALTYLGADANRLTELPAWIRPPHCGGERTGVDRSGDDVGPELTRGKTMHWLKTRRILKQDRHALGLPKHFYFLTPTKGFNLGEYLYGRTLGAKPVDGAVRMTLPSARTSRTLRRGQVVVVTLDPRSSGAMGSFDELLTKLSRNGLSPVSVDDLAGSPAVRA